MSEQPRLNQLNLVTGDMDATVAFYRRLGLMIEAEPAAPHVSVQVSGGVSIEWDSVEFVTQWDTGWKGATGGSTVVGFSLPSRQAVDEVYSDLTGAGYAGHQPPYDAFWGARYAIVDDPDGNGVGLQSPVEQDRKFWPPSEPPPLP
ncbi:MAG: VOC family protein [Acidimicrobiales bacterium]